MGNCNISVPAMKPNLKSNTQQNLKIDIVLEADNLNIKELADKKIPMLLFQLKQPDGKIITLGIKNKT
jgi:hypothetical protein